jgi:phenylpropionate dioxygenase-like ring-hydroxylating dioxygenase large terminal subunit
MSLSNTGDLREPFTWPEAGVTRIPYRLFTDPDIYAMEQERIFRGPTWNFLCMEIDIPNPGDYKTSVVGEIPVVTTRDENGEIHAMVNRCAHKGALVCLKERGNGKMLHCVYHSWSFDLQGRLRGIAFRNGIRGKGGMPEDFDAGKHRLEPLRVESFCGMIFGTFSDETPPMEEYLGESVSWMIKRNMEGRKLKPLGMHSQVIHNNWKLYAENVRDSYHATLLHTFYTTFKVNRLDMDGGMIIADDKWHSISYAKRHTLDEAEEYKRAKVHSAAYESQLHGPHLLDSWEEYEDGITHVIQTVFPNLAIHYTLNSLCVRFFAPQGPDKTELFWWYLGDENDSDAETGIRAMQGNLTGAAGLVSLEDGCINEFVQRGVQGSGHREAFIEMGGREAESQEGSRATESAIRGFWTGYRGIMGFE